MSYYHTFSIVGIILLALQFSGCSGEFETALEYQDGMCKMVQDGLYPPEFCKH